MHSAAHEKIVITCEGIEQKASRLSICNLITVATETEDTIFTLLAAYIVHRFGADNTHSFKWEEQKYTQTTLVTEEEPTPFILEVQQTVNSCVTLYHRRPKTRT